MWSKYDLGKTFSIRDLRVFFPHQKTDFEQERSALFPWSGPQFPHPHLDLVDAIACLLVGTIVRSSTSFSSSEFVFLATIRELSSKSTFCSSCLVLASSRDILFCSFNLAVSFWCWWCCCVTLLLFLVGVRLLFLWRGWWHFYVFVFWLFSFFEVFLDILYWLDSVSGSLQVALPRLHVRHLQNRVVKKRWMSRSLLVQRLLKFSAICRSNTTW